MASAPQSATLAELEDVPQRPRKRDTLRAGINRVAGATGVTGALASGSLARVWNWVLLALVFAAGAYAWGSGLLPQIIELREDIVYLLREHLLLVGVSGALAILVGLPLGIWLSRPSMRGSAEYLIQVLNVGTTIPTLAILALSMSVLGIGKVPAIFGLFVATLLPIVRNAYAGCQSVPNHLIEAATGMGMTPFQILWRVEIPNALFVMFAGIRTALAINVGTVPLAFLIGGGGLGELIFQGIALNDFAMMLAGAIPTALLAVIVDLVLSQLQYWLIPRGVNPLR